LALLKTWPKVSSLRLDILRRSLRCIAAQAGVTLTTRHLTWYLSCFLRTYLALLNAVLVPKVKELETRTHHPPPLFIEGGRSKLTGRVKMGVGRESRCRGHKISSIFVVVRAT
jgi:hypothetical protein